MRLPSPLYVILDRSRRRGPRPARPLAVGPRRRLPPGAAAREDHAARRALAAGPSALAQQCREAGALLHRERSGRPGPRRASADGLHVGQDDLPAREARRAPASGNDPGRLDPRSGAGAARAPPTAPTTSRWAASSRPRPRPASSSSGPISSDASVPRCRSRSWASAGITPDNASAVIEAGADAVAVISAVCAAPDPEVATRRSSSASRPARARRPPRRPGAPPPPGPHRGARLRGLPPVALRGSS